MDWMTRSACLRTHQRVSLEPALQPCQGAQVRPEVSRACVAKDPRAAVRRPAVQPAVQRGAAAAVMRHGAGPAEGRRPGGAGGMRILVYARGHGLP